jgi:hypothetical protein
MSLVVIDVGTGTQDILVYHPKEPIERNPKMVLPSPTVVKAKMITKAKMEGRSVFLEGYCMGGGPIVRAIREHVQSGLNVYATKESILTKEHAPETDVYIMYIDMRAVGKGFQESALPSTFEVCSGIPLLCSKERFFRRWECPLPTSPRAMPIVSVVSLFNLLLVLAMNGIQNDEMGIKVKES